MRFFMIYPNQWNTGNKPIGIATLSAVLKGAGHDFKLFDFTQFDLSSGLSHQGVGEVSLEFRRVSNPERMPKRQQTSKQAVFTLLRQEIDKFKPDMIGLSVLSDDYPLGLEALRYVRKYFQIPTIVGGVHAAVDPEGVIREASVDMVCVGEGEGAILDIAERLDCGEDVSTVANMWVKTPDRVIRNPVRPLIQDLDTLPYPDWTIFPEAAFYKPFNGYVYKYGDFEMSRGCPYTCSYCINVELQQVYKDKGKFHREKSVKRVVEEVSWFKKHYGIEFLKFWDETFLLMSYERLQDFAREYGGKVGIPFAIETTAQSVTPRTAPLLRQFGCATASLGLETGNVDLRKGILDKNTDDRSYVQAYKLLREHGIRGVSFNMIGLPFERRNDIFDTIRSNKKLGTEAQSVGIFYPYKGTPIRTFCETRGLLDKDFEFNLLAQPTSDFVTYTRGVGSVLKLSDVTREELVRLRNFFAYYVAAPEWLWPLIDQCGHGTSLSQKLSSVMFQCLYRNKYGEREVMKNPKPTSPAKPQTTPSPFAADISQLRAELPSWMEAFLSACETDSELAAEFVLQLKGSWESRGVEPERAVTVSSADRVSSLDGGEDFNRGGQLDRSRLAEIRKEMRQLAKEDALVLLSDISRR